MRSDLSIYDRFAIDFTVTFNGYKSNCIMFKACNRCAIRDNIAPVSHFLLGGRAIGIALTWPHLGHIFSANLLDDDDIRTHRNRFIGQTNNLLFTFSKVGVSVRNMLFKSYSSSLYGAELWDLAKWKTEDYCIAWRKGLRKVWQVPYDASSLNVAFISYTVPFVR
jgi:hypothetical protein